MGATATQLYSCGATLSGDLGSPWNFSSRAALQCSSSRNVRVRAEEASGWPASLYEASSTCRRCRWHGAAATSSRAPIHPWVVVPPRGFRTREDHGSYSRLVVGKADHAERHGVIVGGKQMHVQYERLVTGMFRSFFISWPLEGDANVVGAVLKMSERVDRSE